MRLSALYQTLSTEEREELAKRAGTSAAYLYQLAKRWDGRKPSIPLLVKLAEADSRLSLTEMVAEFNEVPPPKTRAEPETNGV